MPTLPPLLWTTSFAALYKSAQARYEQGASSAAEILPDPNDKAQLASLGISQQVLFDFVEDRYESHEVTLLVALRRDYFYFVQHGIPSGKSIPEPEFPRKTDELEGIAWLARFILKAQCFLKGELPENLMFGCSGDRSFCAKNSISLAEFLHFVWLAGEEAHVKCVAWITSRRELGSN